MAFPRSELGRTGGRGRRVLPILPGGGQPPGDRLIGRVGLQPPLVPAAVRQFQLRRRPLLPRELQQLLQR